MPTRLPSNVKKLKGTFRADRSSRREPTPAASRVPAPPRGSSAAFRRNWRDLSAQVDSLGVFAESDLSAFRLLVTALTLVDEMPTNAPASAVSRILQSAMGLLSRFGLTPADRGRVENLRQNGGAGADPDSEFDQRGLHAVK
jgi:hypothetical protein